MRVLRAIVSIFLAVSFAAPAAAGRLEDGIAADDRGDRATARRLLRPLAQRGNAEAQLRYGNLLPFYEPEQMKWFRRAQG